MSRDKQIEEMARVICQSNRDGICGYDGEACNFDCGSYQLAAKVYTAGYRKSTDVSEEIFELIDCAFSPVLVYNGYTVKEYLAELKKKYESEKDK